MDHLGRNILLGIGGSILVMIYLGWKTSIVSAEIYNQQNGTNYTASDFFWAGDQINSQSQTINLKTK